MRLKTSKYDRTGAITLVNVWVCKPLLSWQESSLCTAKVNSFYGVSTLSHAPLGDADVLSIICGECFTCNIYVRGCVSMNIF